MDHINYIDVAGLVFALQTENEICVTHNFKDFIKSGCSLIVDCKSNIKKDEMEFSIPKEQLIAQDYDNEVFREKDGRYIRLYREVNGKKYYAMSRQVTKGKESVIRYLPEYEDVFCDMNQCFHLIGWEQMLAWHERLILHASCIQTEYGGILFSGVSGAGKSTQADLWIRNRGARLINGDRTILYKNNTIWEAYGSPFAGSSNCHLNKKTPIRAIVMLRQGENNTLKRLSEKEAFYYLYPMSTVYTWDKEFVNRIINILSLIVQEVPVYQMICTPDENAVKILEAELRKVV